MIASWHFCCFGFLQPRLGAPTGMHELWHLLHRSHAGPDCAVERLAWNDSAQHVAESVRLCRNSALPTVRIYGYSWGAALAVRIARELRDRGYSVADLVLSDPVYRHRYFAGNWRACFPGWPIVVPANVARVTWWRQTRHWPRGHAIVAGDPARTALDFRGAVPLRHEHMDELAAFHARALEIAGENEES